MKVRVHRFVARTEVEGPGTRAALWVQGCSIRCPGCFNPLTWTLHGGTEVHVSELVALLADGPEVEGLTLLGGEPFDQANALAQLGSGARALGLGVMTFTGYTYEELCGGPDPGWSRLLEQTDLLVDGPFVAELPDHNRPWVGSTNQRFRFLTDRYRELADRLQGGEDRLEVHIAPGGQVTLNGMASDEVIRGFSESIGNSIVPPSP